MSPSLRESIEFGAFIAASIILAFVINRVIIVFAARMARSESSIGGELLRAIRIPVVVLTLLVGLYGALGRYSILNRVIRDYSSVFEIAGVLIVILGLTNIANLLILWSSRKFSKEFHDSHLNLLRKLVIIAIWMLGSVQVLLILGVKVTAVLASLGVASLAIGLALQDTIANLFAGFYLVADRSVNAGDYIKLESGEEGFVESIGWRNTRIRLWANNTVLIPNAKLTQSVITNLTLPNPVLSVYTYCGVSYESDLEFVESTALEVAREVLETHPGSDLSFDPVLRYKEFGDSNINFVVVFRVTEVGSQYLLQHEYIKALHKRFKERNIEISYPVRKLISNN